VGALFSNESGTRSDRKVYLKIFTLRNGNQKCTFMLTGKQRCLHIYIRSDFNDVLRNVFMAVLIHLDKNGKKCVFVPKANVYYKKLLLSFVDFAKVGSKKMLIFNFRM